MSSAGPEQQQQKQQQQQQQRYSFSRLPGQQHEQPTHHSNGTAALKPPALRPGSPHPLARPAAQSHCRGHRRLPGCGGTRGAGASHALRVRSESLRTTKQRLLQDLRSTMGRLNGTLRSLRHLGLREARFPGALDRLECTLESLEEDLDGLSLAALTAPSATADDDGDGVCLPPPCLAAAAAGADWGGAGRDENAAGVDGADEVMAAVQRLSMGVYVAGDVLAELQKLSVGGGVEGDVLARVQRLSMGH